MRYCLLLGLLALLWISPPPLYAAGQRLDSLMNVRAEKFDDYSRYKNNMTDRTWSNLLELGKKAGAVIEIDQILISEYLEEEIAKNTDLKTSIEKMSLEMALLHKEAEVRGVLLRERQNQVRTFLIILVTLTFILILSILVMIDRHKKYKFAVAEMERIWSASDDKDPNSATAVLKDQIRKLNIENNKIKKELIILSDQKKDARKKLEDEIRSRQIMEREIKNLIGQIKKK